MEVKREYIRDLIRQDQKRKSKEDLETLLLEGLDSGTATPMSDRDWTEIRQAVRDKLDRQKHELNSQASAGYPRSNRYCYLYC